MAEKLNDTQKKYISEIDEIIDLVGLDYNKILNYDKEARTESLLNIKDQIIRSSVLMEYLRIDWYLTQIIIRYYFGEDKSMIDLWKNKKFELFNYHILEKLYLINKLELAKKIIQIPESINNKISKINDLRNSLAHSLFPENRRVKVLYNNKSIQDMQGFKEYQDDINKVTEFFIDNVLKATN